MQVSLCPVQVRPSVQAALAGKVELTSALPGFLEVCRSLHRLLPYHYLVCTSGSAPTSHCHQCIAACVSLWKKVFKIKVEADSKHVHFAALDAPVWHVYICLTTSHFLQA